MNDEKKVESHLDCLSLLQQVKNSLSIGVQDNIVLFKDSDTFRALLDDKDWFLFDGIKEYLSPVFLLDKDNEKYYPVLFYHVKECEGKVRLEHSIPFYNPMVLEILDDNHISCDIQYTFNNSLDIIRKLEMELERKALMNRYSFVYGVSFFDCSVITCASIYQVLLSYVAEKSVPDKYLGLFKEVKEDNIEKEIQNSNVGCFVRFDHILTRLKNYHCSKMSYQGNDILTDTLMRLIDALLENEENIIFVVPDSEKNNIKDILHYLGVDDFIFDYDAYTLSKMKDVFDKKEYKQPTIEESFIQRYDLSRDKFLSFCTKNEEIFSALRNNLYPIGLEILQGCDEINSYQLDVSNYTEDDYKSDAFFFDKVREYKSIYNICLDEHPLYGLVSSSSKESYDSLQLLLNRMKSSISDFSEKIKNTSIFNDYEIRISSFEDFERVKKAFDILSEYNGFPRKYFKLSLQEGQNTLSLDQLKLRYQALSSSTLVVSNLFKEEIFNEDISKLLDGYRYGNFFKKNKAKKKLLSFANSKNNQDIKTLVRILGSYIESKKELDDILPFYKDTYGDNVSNMNGVMEIESNVRYIDKFAQYQKENPNFNIDNPFVKRYLKDKDFRVDSQSQIRELNDIYSEIKNDINQFIGLFFDTKKNYFSLNFNDFISLLDSISGESYDDFVEYTSFIESLKESSILLQLVVKKYIESKKELDKLEDEYLLSIVKSYYQLCKKEFKPYEEGMLTSKNEYLKSLADLFNIHKSQRYQTALDNVLKVKNNLDIDQFRDLDNKLENGEYNTQDKHDYFNLLFHICPISIASPDELIALDDDTYDHVVIYDSGLLNNTELLNSYRIGKDILLIDDKKVADIRTQGYHETFISKEVLYQKVFSFNLINGNILKKLENKYSLYEDDRYPFIYKKDNLEFALLPDCLMDKNHDINFVLELAEFLAQNENLYIDVIDLLEVILKK